MKIQPRRVSAHFVAVHIRGCFVFLGQKPEAVRAHIERAENASPLLRGLRVDQHPILGSLDATVDLGGIGHPLDEFNGCRQIGKQMREDFLRSFDEEAIGHAFGLIQRHGQGLRLGLAPEFLRRVPVRHPGVERIEHDVAAMRIVKLFHKLAGGIVDDGAVAASVYLIKHLADDARLARAGVADNEKVLVSMPQGGFRPEAARVV